MPRCAGFANGLHALSAQCVCNLLPFSMGILALGNSIENKCRPRGRRESCSLSPDCGSDECAASDGLMRHSAPGASSCAAGDERALV